MNKAKSEIKNLLLLLILGMVFITSSCTWFSSSKPDDKKATLYIKVSNSGKNVPKNKSRTIKAEDFTKDKFTNVVLKGKYFSSSEEELLTADSLDALAATITVNSGFWDFTLSAEYNGLLFSDTKSYTVKSEGTNTVSFNLKAVEDFGGCEISFTFTQTSVEKALVSLQSLQGAGGTKVIDGENLLVSSVENGKKCDFTRSLTNAAERLPSGKYLLSFDFYGSSGSTSGAASGAGAADILLNHYESYLVITAGQIAKADINLDLNAIYTITYKDGSETVIDDDVASGLLISSYSKYSEFDLPTITKSGYIFQGWQKNGSGDLIQKIDRNTYGDITLVASFIEAKLYVSGVGDDTSGDGSLDNPFESIDKACEKIIELECPDTEWTICIDGEVTGPHEGSNTHGLSSISADVTLDHAKSITITGKNGRDSNGSILAGTEDTSHNIIEPVDILNRGSTGSGRTSPVLSINTTVPVTITNLKITGGNGENGGGIFIKEGATVSIGDGVLITQNRSIRGGAIFNQGTLFIYGTAILGKIGATDYASDDSSKNDTNSSNGGGIYNGDTAATVAKTTIIAKLYLGYKLSDDGVTPEKEELKGGIYYCWANSGGGIYNAIKSLVYFDSGTIQYNGVKNYGGGLYNNDASRLEMTGGKIIKNSASQTSSVMNGGGVCNDWLNSVFIMSGGLINENRAWCTGTGTSNGKGGGVFNGGKMFMYGTAVIGNKDASASATEDSCGNKANIGGGIYNDYTTDRRGYLYIGYEPDADGITPKEADFSGGIYNNYSKDNSNGNNKDGGGAIYSTAFPPNYGDVRIAKGTIAYNSTEDYGGAYCGKEITITGGSILNNSAGKKGGAIYLKDNTTSTLSIGGSIQIPYTGTKETGYQNDICPSVYSKTYYTKIKILSALTNHSASNQLRITPENYHEGIQLITIDSAAETDYATELPKFVITPEIHTEYNTRADWEFNDSGKLHSRIPFAEITVAFSDPDINVSATYNNGYKAGAGVIQGTRNVVFTADPGYTYTWMLDDDIITNTVASDDAVAILSDKNDGTNNVLTINTLKLIHGGIYDVYLEAEKAGIKYSYMAQMKIQNY